MGDPDDVLNRFYLRILGRHLDLAPTTGASAGSGAPPNGTASPGISAAKPPRGSCACPVKDAGVVPQPTSTQEKRV